MDCTVRRNAENARLPQTRRNTAPRDERCHWIRPVLATHVIHRTQLGNANPAPAQEAAENLPQQTSPTAGGVRGYSPVLWCAERLPPAIRVLSPEELVWRIRMKHAPAQTKEFMSRLGR